MKTHIDYYGDAEDGAPERALCGTFLGENPELTSDWRYVDCKLCIMKRKKIEQWHKETEEIIVKQMGDFVAFVKKEEAK